MAIKKQPLYEYNPDEFDDDDDDSLPPPPPPPENFDDSFSNEEDPRNYSPAADMRPPQPRQQRQSYRDRFEEARKLEEEEAGVDEIEVPTSRVVQRMNRSEAIAAKKAMDDEYKRAQHTPFWRRKCFILAILALTVTAIVIGAVFGTRKNNDDRQEDPTATTIDDAAPSVPAPSVPAPVPTGAPAPVGTPPPTTEEFSQKAAILASLGMTSPPGPAYNEPNSPQNLALEYIKDDDLSTDNAKALAKQKFVAATMYHSFGADQWDSNNWMTTANVCEWDGIECAEPAVEAQNQGGGLRNLNDDGSTVSPIQKLSLSQRKIIGTIPEEIGLLSELEEISIFANQLSGPIPESIYTLPNLQVLDLEDNLLNGTISTGIGNLSKMVFLALDWNKLGGPIPSEIGNMEQLDKLWLNSNELTGTIPTEIGKLTFTRNLLVDNNSLSGPLPAEIGNMAALGMYADVFHNF